MAPGLQFPSASPSAGGKGRPTEEGSPCGRLSAGSADPWPWWPPWCAGAFPSYLAELGQTDKDKIICTISAALKSQIYSKNFHLNHQRL